MTPARRCCGCARRRTSSSTSEPPARASLLGALAAAQVASAYVPRRRAGRGDHARIVGSACSASRSPRRARRAARRGAGGGRGGGRDRLRGGAGRRRHGPPVRPLRLLGQARPARGRRAAAGRGGLGDDGPPGLGRRAGAQRAAARRGRRARPPGTSSSTRAWCATATGPGPAAGATRASRRRTSPAGCSPGSASSRSGGCIDPDEPADGRRRARPVRVDLGRRDGGQRRGLEAAAGRARPAPPRWAAFAVPALRRSTGPCGSPSSAPASAGWRRPSGSRAPGTASACSSRPPRRAASAGSSSATASPGTPGPSLLTMPWVRELFADTGAPLADELELLRVEPVTRYRVRRRHARRAVRRPAARARGARGVVARRGRRLGALPRHLRARCGGRRCPCCAGPPPWPPRLVPPPARARRRPALARVKPWHTLRALARAHVRDPRLRHGDRALRDLRGRRPAPRAGRARRRRLRRARLRRVASARRRSTRSCARSCGRSRRAGGELRLATPVGASSGTPRAAAPSASRRTRACTRATRSSPRQHRGGAAHAARRRPARASARSRASR